MLPSDPQDPPMAKYGVVEPTEAEQANPKLTQKTPEQKTAQALDALKPNKPEEPK